MCCGGCLCWPKFHKKTSGGKREMQLTLTRALICQQLYLMWQAGPFQPIYMCYIWPYPEELRPNSVKRQDLCWSRDQTYVRAPGQERTLRNGATCPTRNHRLRIAFYMLDNWCPPEMLACHLGLQIWHIAPTTNTSIQHEKCGDHTAIHDNSRLQEWWMIRKWRGRSWTLLPPLRKKRKRNLEICPSVANVFCRITVS